MDELLVSEIASSRIAAVFNVQKAWYAIGRRTDLFGQERILPQYLQKLRIDLVIVNSPDTKFGEFCPPRVLNSVTRTL